MGLINAISIDVEDYFQVSAFEHSIDRNDWDSIEHRIVKSTQQVLDLLAVTDTKATFFTLGWVAERYPEIIKRIVRDGHELASHGYGHQRVTDLSPEQFKTDIIKAKAILENISGVEIKGYRAPSYSIGKKNIWALDVLAETEHEYSSSIYPIQHDHYGYPEAPRFIFKDKKTGLIEIPITTMKFMNHLFPAGGGGFFRLYPYRLSKWVINRVNQQDKMPSIFYFHPWEIDPDQPRQQNISAKSRFRHYLNLDKTEGRLKSLLNDFNWGRMDEVFINNKKILEYELS